MEKNDLTSKKRKPIGYYMRLLHRDIGFLLIGFTLVFCLSGVVLVFRNTDVFKQVQVVEKMVDPNLNAEALGKALRKKDFKVVKTEGDTVYFKSGTYNKATGQVAYSESKLPLLLNKMTSLHMSSTQSFFHLATIVFAVLLLFLAVSAFWMFKPNTKQFKRGAIIGAIGLIVAITLLVVI